MIKNPFPFVNLIKLDLKYPPNLRYIPKAIGYIILVFLQLPWHWLELLLYKKKIENYQLKEDPVFILGYWRSGTTYLQRLMARNKELAFFNQYDAFFPLGSILTAPIFKPLMNALVYVFRIKHPSHKVLLSMNFPTEEDIAFVNMGYPDTPMWSHMYSGNAMEIYKELAKKEEEEPELFIDTYTYIIKKLSYTNNGKRLVMKSPMNTRRIPQLLKAFPNADFVYIHRNPKSVYLSNMKLLWNNRHQWLQSMNKEEMKEFFAYCYKDVMEHYQEHKYLIPPENLLEISFESLLQDPMGQLEKISENCGLPMNEEQRVIYRKFLERKHGKGREKHQEEVPEEIEALLEEVAAHVE